MKKILVTGIAKNSDSSSRNGVKISEKSESVFRSRYSDNAVAHQDLIFNILLQILPKIFWKQFWPFRGLFDAESNSDVKKNKSPKKLFFGA